MTRRMADSAAIAYIDPSTIDLIGYYVDGNYVPTASQLARFAGKVHVPIAVHHTTNAGIVFDGPPDNDSWDGVVDWVVMRRKAGVDPSVYTNGASWATAIQRFNARGVAQPHWWIAEWNNRAEMISGAVAHQYQEVPNRYDLSIVADYWPGIDPKPATPTPPPSSPPATQPTPAPVPLTEEEDDIMMIITAPMNAAGTQKGQFLLSGSLFVPLTEPTSSKAFGDAGVKTVEVTYAQYEALVKGSAALQGKLSGSLTVSGQLNAT